MWLDGEIAASDSRKSCRQCLVELLSFRWGYAVKQANDNTCLLRESLKFTYRRGQVVEVLMCQYLRIVGVVHRLDELVGQDAQGQRVRFPRS